MRQLWAYAYRMVPPPPTRELGELRHLLDGENATAFEHAQPWAAQLILEPRSTQILIVAGTPVQSRPANRRLECALHRLDVSFELTDPIAIRGPEPAPSRSIRPRPARPGQPRLSYSPSPSMG